MDTQLYTRASISESTEKSREFCGKMMSSRLYKRGAFFPLLVEAMEDAWMMQPIGSVVPGRAIVNRRLPLGEIVHKTSLGSK